MTVLSHEREAGMPYRRRAKRNYQQLKEGEEEQERLFNTEEINSFWRYPCGTGLSNAVQYGYRDGLTCPFN